MVSISPPRRQGRQEDQQNNLPPRRGDKERKNVPPVIAELLKKGFGYLTCPDHPRDQASDARDHVGVDRVVR
jgi:hypothetical protein